MDTELWNHIKALETELEALKTKETPRGDFLLPFVTYEALSYNSSTNNVRLFAATLPRDATIIRWRQGYYVATGDAANYWTISLIEWNTLAIVAQFNTTVFGSRTVYDSGAISIAAPATMLGFYIYISKTLAPGNYAIPGPALSLI